MKTRLACLVALATSISACAATMEVAGTPRESAPPDAPPAKSCPLGVDGAAVEVSDVPGGAALTFRSAERTEEVRERARRAAEMRGPGERKGLGHDGGQHRQDGTHHGLQAWMFPPARLAVMDVEDGARLEMVAVYPTDVDRIRLRARERGVAMMACR